MSEWKKSFEETMRMNAEIKQMEEEMGRPMGKIKEVVDSMKGVIYKKADDRYNVPKEAPKASEEMIKQTIEDTEIYKRANMLINSAQYKQVGYGLDKYPEPLNADTWTTLETIDHIIDESVDKLHYLIMLRIKLEREAEKELKDSQKEMEPKLYADYPLIYSESETMSGVNTVEKFEDIEEYRRDDIDALIYAISTGIKLGLDMKDKEK